MATAPKKKAESGKAVTTAKKEEQAKAAAPAAAPAPEATKEENPEQQPSAENVEKPASQPEETAEPRNEDRPPYDLTPEQQSEEQKAYVAEFNRYIELYGDFPNADLSTADLKEANDKKAEQDAQPPHAPEASQAGTAKAPQAKSDDRYVVIQDTKTGETRRIKRRTWDLLKKAPQQFKEVANVPAEVEALNKSKGGK